jgi:hypothetical protein
VSEYQYYEFLAVDRPLDPDQLQQVRALSSRARITSTSFVNTYNWGDFRGDPRKLVEEYYDAFLYTANWGARRLMLRLPARLLDLATAQRYCGVDSSSVRASGENVIVELCREGDGEDYWDEGEGDGSLASIIPVRALLASGDLRLLYLGWLLAVGAEELDDDEMEPPVPANLAVLSASLRSVVDFLGVDEDLLAVAAEASERQHAKGRSEAELAAWIKGLPAAEKDALLLRVVSGDDAHLRAELVRRFNGQPGVDEQSVGRRTVAELLDAAQAYREKRERRAGQQRDRERARREREAALARGQHLDSLEQEGERAWQRVGELIDTKKIREYDTAVELLVDLRDLCSRQGRAEEFERREQQIRQQYSNRPGLLQRMDKAGLKATAGQ